MERTRIYDGVRFMMCLSKFCRYSNLKKRKNMALCILDWQWLVTLPLELFLGLLCWSRMTGLRNINIPLLWFDRHSSRRNLSSQGIVMCVQLDQWKMRENTNFLWNDHDAFGWPSFITQGFVCWPRKEVDVELTVLHYFAWGLMTFCGQSWDLPTCNVRFFALQVMYQSWIWTIQFKENIFSLWSKEFR